MEYFILDRIEEKVCLKTEHGHVEIDADIPDKLLKQRQIIFIGELEIQKDKKIDLNTCDPKDSELYRFISFMKDDTEHWVYTNKPVYICSDVGRTIETIK